MTTLMPIQSAAMFQVDQVRSLIVVGARSLFQSGLLETSFVSSTKSRWIIAMSAELIDSVAISDQLPRRLDSKREQWPLSSLRSVLKGFKQGA
jgi:hypothetical protein